MMSVICEIINIIKQQIMQNKISRHNNFNFNLVDDLLVNISSDFDAGNLETATITSISPHPLTIKTALTPSTEPFNPQYSLKPSTKSFFHFSIKSNKSIIFQTSIKKMNILSYLQTSIEEYYYLCVGVKEHAYKEPQYQKLKPEQLNLIHQDSEYILEFCYPLQENKTYFFAYHYPYSYQKLRNYLSDLKESVLQKNERQRQYIYFRNQLLIQSLQERQVNLLTITQLPLHSTEKEPVLNLMREPRISKTLFPYFDFEPRPYKFNKPYILISCRVHPGETSASFALEGFLNELCGDSKQAQFIRKCFVVLVVPMVNPDGVYHGTYRMDTLGHNLNRFYNNCVAHKQPSIFAIQSLMQNHADQLQFFLDIHSHPQLKGSFFYGNSFTSIYDQIQSQLLAKILSTNSECFSYEHSSFSQKNMNSKDINELMTKDGSARVFAHKKMNSSIHCYTLQMGYHGCPIKKQSMKVSKFKNDYRRETKEFHQRDYRQNGIALLNTIAQVYIENFRIESSVFLQALREEIAKQIYQKEDRFRMMDIGLLKKLKTIHQTIYNSFYGKIKLRYPHIGNCINDYDQSIVIQPLVSTQYIKQGNGKVAKSLSLSKKKSCDGSASISYNEQLANKANLNKQLFKMIKDKVNLAPFEFVMPKQDHQIKKGVGNKININFNPLPKIQKKHFKKIAQKNKLLSQRRVLSSVTSHKKLAENEETPKNTIESNINDLLYCEKIINQDNEEEELADEKLTNIGVHRVNMNMLHNEMMYKRMSSQDEDVIKFMKNYHTQRVSKKHQIREKKMIQLFENYKTGSQQKQKWFNLPKIEGKPERIRTKFELQLKMKEKYDREYKIENHWKFGPTEEENQQTK